MLIAFFHVHGLVFLGALLCCVLLRGSERPRVLLTSWPTANIGHGHAEDFLIVVLHLLNILQLIDVVLGDNKVAPALATG